MLKVKNKFKYVDGNQKKILNNDIYKFSKFYETNKKKNAQKS